MMRRWLGTSHRDKGMMWTAGPGMASVLKGRLQRGWEEVVRQKMEKMGSPGVCSEIMAGNIVQT